MGTPPAPRRPLPGGDAPGLAVRTLTAEQLCASTGHMPATSSTPTPHVGCLCGGKRYRRILLSDGAV